MRSATVIAFAAVAALSTFSHPAKAEAPRTLHAFCVDLDCTDGQEPRGGLAGDGQGNWYGTTTGGGPNHAGTIYRLHHDGSTWKYTRLYSFCAKANCIDGNFPQGAVIVDTSGALWGMTSSGGNAQNQGMIWKLTPKGAHWTLRTMHTFCNRPDCTDGADPLYGALAYQGQQSGALYDGVSPLYGTTSAGGTNAKGVVFSFTPNGVKGKYEIVYNFCRKPYCADGGAPGFGVAVDGRGHLFGSAPEGGIGAGIVYEMIPDGTRWTMKIAHSFCTDYDGAICHDGDYPFGVPLLGDNGTIYGTAGRGGPGGENGGTVYKLVPKASRYQLVTLHDFCQQADCADGGVVPAGLAMDAAGELVGTTVNGGGDNLGTVFKLSGAHLTAFTLLYSCTVKAGAAPIGAIANGPDGTMVGTFTAGGKNHGGTAFSITP